MMMQDFGAENISEIGFVVHELSPTYRELVRTYTQFDEFKGVITYYRLWWLCVECTQRRWCCRGENGYGVERSTA
jgi:hypothetical protein